MNNVGYFFPLIIILGVVLALGLALIEKWLNPSDTETYEKWLEEELVRNPGYIDWLKCTNRGKDYKLGLKILRKIKQERR